MLVLLVDGGLGAAGGLRPSDIRASRGARRFSCSTSNNCMLLRELARSGDSWRGLRWSVRVLLEDYPWMILSAGYAYSLTASTSSWRKLLYFAKRVPNEYWASSQKNRSMDSHVRWYVSGVA